MKTYLDMDEILRHSHTYIGKCYYDDPYLDLVSAVPEEVIRSLPAADVVEVKHGRWIDKTWTTEDDWSCYNHHIVICSVCNKQFDYVINEKSRYCPNCGAKMDEVQDDYDD